MRARSTLLWLLWRAAHEGEPDAEGRAWDVLGSGIMVVQGERTALDPDVVVVPSLRLDPDALTAPEPLIVVEVIRRGDRAEVWAERLRGSAALPSLRHVLVLDTRSGLALHLWREAAGAEGMSGRIVRGALVPLDPSPEGLDLDRLWADLSQSFGEGDRDLEA